MSAGANRPNDTALRQRGARAGLEDPHDVRDESIRQRGAHGQVSASPVVAVRRVSAAEARERADILAAALADVLIDCVEGGASVSFMLPLARDKALGFWHGVLQAAGRGERVLLVAENADGRIVGTVQLITSQPDNQPHRADLAKMLVHRDARRCGVAAQLLAAADQTAREESKTVLVLDTVTGGEAERLYRRAGWQAAGCVPNYALMPDGAYCGTTFFYKQL